MIDLLPLFEKQKQLDEFIIEKKGLQGQNLLANKTLALQVELGELANEWRGFKYWSDNKKPVYTAQIDCPVCHGKGFKEAATFAYDCNRCGGTGYLLKHPLLEEYVDCLHFILSIGLDIEGDDVSAKWLEWKPEVFNTDDIIEQFNIVLWNANMMREDDYYQELFQGFAALGVMLGFTWEQIEQAYHQKWEENILRQQSGY